MKKITLLKTFIALVAVVIMSAAKTLNAQKTITNLGVNPSFQTSGIAVVQEDLREIKPNETVEGTIKPGEIQSFKIKLEAGQSISIPILNTNVPIRLSSFTPNGELQSEIFVMENLLNEPVIIIAKVSDFYQINLRGYGKGGKYEIKPQMPHETTESDRKYLAALKLPGNNDFKSLMKNRHCES